jgi:kinesin family protein 2/24
VKSLSKGGNAKKDVSLAMPLRESSPSPLPSVVPSFSASEVMNDITERSNFGWPKQQYVKEQPALTFVERMPKVKDAVEFTSSNGAYSREQRSKGFMAPNIVEIPDIMYQQGRQPARKAKDTTLGNNIRNSIAYPTRRVEPDEDEHLNNLLQVVLSMRFSCHNMTEVNIDFK